MKPRVLVTLGDVAGVGPEIVAKAWAELCALVNPVVVGDAEWLRRGVQQARVQAQVETVGSLAGSQADPRRILCLAPKTADLSGVMVGQPSAAAGRAAYDFLCTAIDRVSAGEADAIVTCPLHKKGLHAAGLNFPGHTEILAERTGTREYGMMLFVRSAEIPHGLGVVHVTLHMRLRDVFQHITEANVHEKILLLDRVMRRLCDHPPRLSVAALNPHASDDGLFGDEEALTLAPAVERAAKTGISVSGPWPSDTLFVRARRGEFDGVVAMYHDQGHIALKLLSGLVGAVNITLGLPIVRTSVAHGTAYDIAGQGRADPRSLIEATRVAARLVSRKSLDPST